MQSSSNTDNSPTYTPNNKISPKNQSTYVRDASLSPTFQKTKIKQVELKSTGAEIARLRQYSDLEKLKRRQSFENSGIMLQCDLLCSVDETPC